MPWSNLSVFLPDSSSVDDSCFFRILVLRMSWGDMSSVLIEYPDESSRVLIHYSRLSMAVPYYTRQPAHTRYISNLSCFVSSFHIPLLVHFRLITQNFHFYRAVIDVKYVEWCYRMHLIYQAEWFRIHLSVNVTKLHSGYWHRLYNKSHTNIK